MANTFSEFDAPRRARPLQYGLAVLVSAALLQAPAGDALACGDPALHPGRAEYEAAVAALRQQPPSPVQVRYRLEGMRRIGAPHTLRLWFWSPDGPPAGSYSIAPSDGLTVVGTPVNGTMPASGKLDVALRADRAGYHFVQIESQAPKDGKATGHRTVIPIAVELDAEHRALEADSGRPMHASRVAGFSGPRGSRLMNALGETAPNQPEIARDDLQ